MAYFSNGTEGMDYQSRYCDHCVHDAKQDCPVWLLHLMYCGQQSNNETVETFLSALIPRTRDGLGNEQCKMFIKKP